MGPQVLALLATQSGVIGRHQLVEAGVAPKAIERALRRGELVRLHRGVYIEHNGPPSWQQQCWAAVLALEPTAALSGVAALRATEGAGSRRPKTLEVVVPWSARRMAPAGVSMTRRRDFDTALQPGGGVPRLRYEIAVLDCLDAADTDMQRISELAMAVNSRRTSASRLQSFLSDRSRMRARPVVVGLLEDLATGACSVLEHGYLTRVERPHGLPSTRRQVRAVVRGGVIYRDGVSRFGICLELDGRLHERHEQRERDFDRDLVAVADGATAVRLSYGQVFDRQCWTASQLGRVYSARGWTGQPRVCGSGCSIS